MPALKISEKDKAKAGRSTQHCQTSLQQINERFTDKRKVECAAKLARLKSRMGNFLMWCGETRCGREANLGICYAMQYGMHEMHD